MTYLCSFCGDMLPYRPGPCETCAATRTDHSPYGQDVRKMQQDQEQEKMELPSFERKEAISVWEDPTVLPQMARVEDVYVSSRHEAKNGLSIPPQLNLVYTLLGEPEQRVFRCSVAEVPIEGPTTKNKLGALVDHLQRLGIANWNALKGQNVIIDKHQLYVGDSPIGKRVVLPTSMAAPKKQEREVV